MIVPDSPAQRTQQEHRSENTPVTCLQDVDKKLNLGGTLPSRHIVIASYECAQKLRGYERHFGMLICDESHMLKSPVSKRTQFFTDLVVSRGTVRRLIFLTGTPVLSRPSELFTQVCAPLFPLSPGLWALEEVICQVRGLIVRGRCAAEV